LTSNLRRPPDEGVFAMNFIQALARFLGSRPQSVPQMHGYIDSITTRGVTGWIAFSGHQFELPLVRINGRVIGHMNVQGDRPDAAAATGMPALSVAAKIIKHLTDGENIVEVEWPSGGTVPNGKTVIKYDRDKIAGEHWSAEFASHADHANPTANKYLRWWQCDHIVRAINERVCGEPISGVSEGLYRLVKQRFPERLPAARAISVGAGTGEKEMNALDRGITSHFDLYEVAEHCIVQGRQMARDRGLERQVEFHLANAFEAVKGEGLYDMVFWNQALHHMADARGAVVWSARVLRPGGLFVMDDYVGATRMQWPDEMLDYSTRFRAGLPAAYLASPVTPGLIHGVTCGRPDEDDLIAYDPSECADSANILPAINDYFPRVEVILTGGGVYHCGLSDVLHNIMEAGDTAQLDRALELDWQAVASGLTQYGVALGTK
jgi:ubiquinone/menaquinone biosynthesis C-methylase UbiE